MNFVYSLFLSFDFGHGLILFVLETLVLLEEVVIEGFGENTVYLFSQVDLSHLEFAETVSHHCITQVLINHLFKQAHVFLTELAQTLVDKSAYLWISLLVFINDTLNVILAVLQIVD